MITAPTGWDALWADPDSKMELRFTIDSDSYLDADIADSDCKLTHSMYDSYGIGNVCSAQLTITLLDPEPIASGVRECTLECRLASADGNTTTAWVPQGTYYLDSAEWASDGSSAVLTMYDALALSGIYLFADGVAPSSTTWPMTASAVITQACTRCGITAPSDMTAFSNISCPNVEYITCREALGSLAAIAGGNWTVTKANQLKFVPLADDDISITAATSVSVSELTRTSTAKQVGRIRLLADNENFEYGSGNFVIEGQCFYASNDVAAAAYTATVGKAYQGWEATGVFASPLLELGDYISIENDTIKLYTDSYSLMYSQGCWGTISAPLRDEVERRIEGKTASDRKVNRLAAIMGDTMTSEEFIANVLNRLNGYINAGGGWTYIVPGHGMITYNAPVADPLVGTEATCVVEIKGGSVRIANEKNAPFRGIDDWKWQTVLNAGQVSTSIITAVNIVAGFIGSPSGNYWNLDDGFINTVSGRIGGFTIGQNGSGQSFVGYLYNGLSSLTGTAPGVYVGTNGIACSGQYDTDEDGVTEQHSIAFSGGGIQGYYNGAPVGYLTPNATAETTENGQTTVHHGLQLRGGVIDLRADVLTVKSGSSDSGESLAAMPDYTCQNTLLDNMAYDANTYFEFRPIVTKERFVNGILVSRTWSWYSPMGDQSAKVRMPTKKFVDDELTALKSRVAALETAIQGKADRSELPTFTRSGDTLYITT